MGPVCDLFSQSAHWAAQQNPVSLTQDAADLMPSPLIFSSTQATLCATRDHIKIGRADARSEMEKAIAIALSNRSKHVFLTSMFDQARADAADPRNRYRPLAGLAVSVKDLFDIGGQISTAGSLVLEGSPPAPHDCMAVARLKAAGGAIIGRTNMAEFAFSGVGINPHFGTPANAAEIGEARIPGGSSSGAAVSVATGAAFVGLGSDTGGSIRIPAALNGIVGFKNTARLVPATGAVPLSTTLDTVCALTRSVSDAIVTHEILSARCVTKSAAPLSAYRLAVASTTMLDGLDATVTKAWQRSLGRLRAQGARIEEIALTEVGELASINAGGGFSAAESFAWHRALLAQKFANYDPRVAMRIGRGASMSAADYLDLIKARSDWVLRMNSRIGNFDAVLSPTVPIVAPLIAALAPGTERDEAFFGVNAQLLRNTAVVNMLDGCAISIPCHVAGELPVGLMIWHGEMRDDTVLNIALQMETALEN
jgi:aspartyl-tRNA(Asn)/glutamyl-tRNA(Gln) amidotransferase subunit A